MPTCVTLIGYPAVDKSTYSRQLEEQGWTIISTDRIIEDVLKGHGLSRPAEWEPFREEIREKVDATIQRAVMQQENIVFDALNITLKRRERHMGLIHSLDPSYSFEAVVVHAPEEDEHAARLTDRYFKRERGYHKTDAFVQAEMARSYEAPTLAEGFDKISEIGVAPKQPLFVSYER